MGSIGGDLASLDKALRSAIEAGMLVALLPRPRRAVDARLSLEFLGLAALCLGLPVVAGTNLGQLVRRFHLDRSRQ